MNASQQVEASSPSLGEHNLTEPVIVVVGSLNMDLVTVTDHVPDAGETVLGSSFHTFCGGKGANQAVACARLGAKVHMIGCIGDDSFGQDLLHNLEAEGIDCSGITIIQGKSSGTAAITINDHDNRIIVVPGANGEFTATLVEKHRELIQAADLLLMQLEVPMETVKAAAFIAQEHRVPIMLNPAPAAPLDAAWMETINWFTPNEHELSIMLGNQLKLETDSPSAMEHWGALLGTCPERIIMTKGADGALWTTADGQVQHTKGLNVEVKDTTGAGDTFNGALAVSLAEGRCLEEAVKRSVAAGALSVTRFGAQGGMPTRTELEAFLQTGKISSSS
ncbi:ribokinase [Paenibacillus aquistagni]|uniref:ribokinase n=1 Tax=Paenibacillus aquistagni TaxID=1852522 RepID=UPI000B5088D5|nr:ribokinase [Paenibacillus aquistagni]